MQLRGPAPHVMNLGRPQRDLGVCRETLQPLERFAVQRERAGGEAALDLEVNEVAPDVVVDCRRVVHGLARVQGLGGSSRDSAALAISPTRLRNSVPMSAV